MSAAKISGLRILVGAGSYADAATALQLVERMADGFQAGLGGVLVEEETLEICRIPNQRIVQSSGATTRAPNLEQVRRLMQADARAFRQSLARAAGPTGADWVFSQDKGELVQASLHAAAGWDVLIIGYRKVNRLPGKIVLLQGASSTLDEMREVSARMSDRLSAARIVYSVGAGSGSGPSVTASDTLHFDTLESSLKALARTNAQAVLVDLRHGPLQTQSDLARVLEASRCPVIVFGTSATNRALEHTIQIPQVTDTGSLGDH